MKMIRNIALSGEAYHLIHHIPASRHNETYIIIFPQYLSRSLYKIFRTFLHRNAP